MNVASQERTLSIRFSHDYSVEYSIAHSHGGFLGFHASYEHTSIIEEAYAVINSADLKGNKGFPERKP